MLGALVRRIRSYFCFVAGFRSSQAAERRLRPTNAATAVRSVLRLAASPSASTSPSWLLDATGRKVMRLRLGPNDISRLAPGVYFVRAVGGEPSAASCHKVVVQR